MCMHPHCYCLVYIFCRRVLKIAIDLLFLWFYSVGHFIGLWYPQKKCPFIDKVMWFEVCLSLKLFRLWSGENTGEPTEYQNLYIVYWWALVTSSLLETLGNLSSGATASCHALEGILLGDEQRTDYNQSFKKNATNSQTSFTRTLNWIPIQSSALQGCRSGGCMKAVSWVLRELSVKQIFVWKCNTHNWTLLLSNEGVYY